jgi:hypothetical protein
MWNVGLAGSIAYSTVTAVVHFRTMLCSFEQRHQLLLQDDLIALLESAGDLGH